MLLSQAYLELDPKGHACRSLEPCSMQLEQGFKLGAMQQGMHGFSSLEQGFPNETKLQTGLPKGMLRQNFNCNGTSRTWVLNCKKKHGVWHCALWIIIHNYNYMQHYFGSWPQGYRGLAIGSEEPTICPTKVLECCFSKPSNCPHNVLVFIVWIDGTVTYSISCNNNSILFQFWVIANSPFWITTHNIIGLIIIVTCGETPCKRDTL